MDQRDSIREWALLPYFVLRMAGFPFGWLADLADEHATAAAAGLLLRRRAVDEAARQAKALAAQGAGGRGGVARRLLRAMAHRRSPAVTDAELAAAALPAGLLALHKQFRQALSAEAAAEDSFDRAYADASRSSGGRVVRRFHSEPLLRDMLLVTNDDAYEVLTGWADTHAGTGQPLPQLRSRDRAKLDTLVRYLQRACAKNDTHSHFGPFAPGAFDPGVAGVAWRVGQLERHPQLSRWAAQALLAALAARVDPALLLRPRRASAAAVRDGVLDVVDFDYSARRDDVREVAHPRPAVPLSPVAEQVLALCDGESPVEQILDRLRAAGSPLRQPDLLAHLDALAAQGALVPGPELPVGIEDSLAALEETVRQHLPPDRGAVLDSVRTALGDLARGDTPTRHRAVQALHATFTGATGEPAGRNHGLFYGDRSVSYEESLSWCRDLAIGPPVTDVLARELAPVYDLFLLRPRVRLLGERELIGGWLTERFGAGQPVTVLDYLRAYLADADRLAPRYARIEEAVARIGREADQLLLAGVAAGARRHRLDPARFALAVHALGPAEPAICNPDVLLVAASAGQLRQGSFQAIIGDLHAIEEVISHQMFAPFLERRFTGYAQAVVAAYQEVIAADEEIVDVIQLHRNKAYVQALLPCRDIEAYGRSPKKRGDVLSLADLVVVPGDGGPRLAVRGSDRFLRLMALPFSQLAVRPNPFAVFGFPRHFGGLALDGAGQDHLPRLEVGRLVVQRELWRVPAQLLADRDERRAFVQVQQVRAERSLPRHVFARLPNEPKPVYCDLDSPLLVRQLTRMAAGAVGTVELSEMVPGPEDLWLQRDGMGYTTEIRFTAVCGSRRHG
ncbi:MAG TPA: lantibiotic dehydratase [Micromonosporaceae bacterium]|nr:lantibiotic dehydratase [Micromonosporaceae bacterium]